jgi:hypothetical protein
VFWARKEGWIVVFIPNGFESINHKMGGKFIEESKIEPGTFDQPVLGVKICKSILEAHRHQLEKIKLKTQFNLVSFQRNENTNLANLLEFGQKYMLYSCNVLRFFREELNLVTEFPVLIAIDGLNCFYDVSRDFKDPSSVKENIHPAKLKALPPLYGKKFTIGKIFTEYRHHGLANGTFIATTTYQRNPNPFLIEHQFLTNRKYELTIIPKFRRNEFDSYLNYYLKSEKIDNNFGGGFSSFLYELTGGIGRELTNYLFYN